MSVQCAVCELEISPDEAFESWMSDGEMGAVCSDLCWQELLENPELYSYETEEDQELVEAG